MPLTSTLSLIVLIRPSSHSTAHSHPYFSLYPLVLSSFFKALLTPKMSITVTQFRHNCKASLNDQSETPNQSLCHKIKRNIRGQIPHNWCWETIISILYQVCSSSAGPMEHFCWSADLSTQENKWQRGHLRFCNTLVGHGPWAAHAPELITVQKR